MGICQSMCASTEIRQQTKRNKEIEKELEKTENVLVQKVLLLGPGESGKSTVQKQMRMMHSEKMDDAELESKKLLIFQMLLQSMTDLLEVAHKMNLEIPKDLSEAEEILMGHVRKHEKDKIPIPPEIVVKLKLLWESHVIKLAYSNKKLRHVTDSTEYFYNDLDRLFVPGYQPNKLDILHTRVPTTGINTCQFTVKSIRLEVIDVGGQRSERKKWIRAFDSVDAILYVAAISEYDQTLVEDNKTNRIDEALALFYTIANSQFFLNSSIIIFLNKIDIFREKMKKIPLVQYCPKFTKENTPENGMRYFQKEFKSCITDRSRKSYIHETCAVSDQVQIIINSVIDTVVQDNLRDTGMI